MNWIHNKAYYRFIVIMINIFSALITVSPVLVVLCLPKSFHCIAFVLIPFTVSQIFFIATPVLNVLEAYRNASSKRGLIHEKDIYALFKEDGTAKLHVGDIDTLPRYNVEIPETKVTMVPKEAFWIQDSEIWQETGEPTKRLLPTCTTCGKELGMQFFEDDTFKHCPGCGNRITLARIPNGWLEEFKAQEELRMKLRGNVE